MNRKINKRLTSTILVLTIAGGATAAAQAAPAPSVPLIDRPADNFDGALIRAERQAAKARLAAQRRKREAAEAVFAPNGGAVAGVALSALNSIASCESGGDPTAVNAAGYYGKYQFDIGTWASVGGSGNPAEASEAEQDYRAGLLYARAGSSPWPVCGA